MTDARIKSAKESDGGRHLRRTANPTFGRQRRNTPQTIILVSFADRPSRRLLQNEGFVAWD